MEKTTSRIFFNFIEARDDVDDDEDSFADIMSRLKMCIHRSLQTSYR